VRARVFAIALNTFREAIRHKVLYGILVVVVLANLFALILGEMSLHNEARVAVDVGLGGLSLFGSITAIALGVTLLYNEVQKKTIHVILAKPLERYEFVLGKYLGMAITLTLLVALFALFLAALLALASAVNPGDPIRWTSSLTKAVLLGWMEVLIVAALAVFFSSFSTPYLSGIFTFAIFFLGRTSDEIRLSILRFKRVWIRGIAWVGLNAIPDLRMFGISGGEIDGKPVTVHAEFVTWGYVGSAALYAFCWMAGLLLLAVLVFRRREFV
jgi:ABC-type transport system involved in multi-copper enzyme maturation permease subunit